MKAKRILACILSATLLMSMFAATSIPSVSAVIQEDDLLLDLDFSAYDGGDTLTDKTGNLTIDTTGIGVGTGRTEGTASAQLIGSEEDSIHWTGADYDPFGASTTGMTLSMWMRVDTVHEWAHYFDFVSQSNTGFLIQYSNSMAININMTDEGASGLSPGGVSDTFPGAGEWMLVTLTQNYENNTLNYYVDGDWKYSAVAKRSIKALAEKGSGDSLKYSIGKPLTIWESDGRGDMSISSVQIYGRALTDAEIANLYDADVPAVEPTTNAGLLLDLDFSGYNGEATLTDTTGNLTVSMSGVESGTGRTDDTKSAKLDSNDAIRWRGEDYDPLVYTNTGVTISIWLRVDTYKEWAHYFDYGRREGFGFLMQYGGNAACNVNMQYNGGNNKTGWGKDAAYPGDSQWMMVTLTQDYATNTMTFYVNGVSQRTDTGNYDIKDIATYGRNNNSEYSIGAPITIFGQWPDASGELSISSVQIYGSVKTAEEIAELYAPTPAVDQDAIDNVISLINAIGEVAATSASLSKITAAETAYAELTEDEQELVTNYTTLTTARTTYDNLMAQPADYDALDALIETIPSDFSIYTTASAEAFQSFYQSFAPNRSLTVADQQTVDGYVATLAAELGKLVLKNVEMEIDISAGMVTPASASGKYDITWNANITVGDETSIELVNENATFVNYGVYYATSEAEVEKLISGEETLLARQVEFGNNDEAELVVYTVYGFRLKNVAADRLRTAVFYLTYECDGTQYTIYSAADTASTAISGD